ncbi:MAG: CooT family nickel-binding protein [Ignisphaera sp.]
MCESKVYVKEGNETKLVIEEAISMTPKNGGYVFIDISGKRYEIDNAVIESIDFIGHKVVLRKIK